MFGVQREGWGGGEWKQMALVVEDCVEWRGSGKGEWEGNCHLCTTGKRGLDRGGWKLGFGWVRWGAVGRGRKVSGGWVHTMVRSGVRSLGPFFFFPFLPCNVSINNLIAVEIVLQLHLRGEYRKNFMRARAPSSAQNVSSSTSSSSPKAGEGSRHRDFSFLWRRETFHSCGLPSKPWQALKVVYDLSSAAVNRALAPSSSSSWLSSSSCPSPPPASGSPAPPASPCPPARVAGSVPTGVSREPERSLSGRGNERREREELKRGWRERKG